jgi:hypothetical protein
MKLLETLKGIQAGKIPDKFGWVEAVQRASDGSYGIAHNGVNGDKANGTVDNVDKLP